MIGILYFLCAIWLSAPLTVALLTGSTFWTIASGVIGGLVVAAWMGVITLIDGDGTPPADPSMAEIEEGLARLETLRREMYATQDAGRLLTLRAEYERLASQVRDALNGLDQQVAG